MAKKIIITVKLPRKPRRAVELYSVEFNFRPKGFGSKKIYRRHKRHKGDVDDRP